MNKKSTLSLIALLSANAMSVDAQTWLCTHEGSYNSANQLRGEKMFHHNALGQKNVSRNENDMTVDFFKYDDNGNLIFEESKIFNEWDNEWNTSVAVQYTYSSNNKISTKSIFNIDFNGGWSIGNYVEYEYNDQDLLIRETMYNNDLKDIVLEKIEYTEFNEAGYPITKNYYFIDGNNVELTGYNKYVYNDKNLITQDDYYSTNINTSQINLSTRTSHVYNSDDKIEVLTVYATEGDDNALVYSNKTEYKYDVTTKELLSSEFSFWNTDAWNKSNIKRYTYSDKLSETKAPANLKAKLNNNSYELSWEAPANLDGLTSYRVYNGHDMIGEVDAANTSYTLSQTPGGVSSLFVTSVYSNGEMNTSNYIEVDALTENVTDEYPSPLFQGVKYIKDLGDGTIDIELHWSEPETDKEIEGYFACYNNWPQNENPIKGTTYKFNVFGRFSDVTLGAFALYADGTESKEDCGQYNIGDLLTGITNSSVDKDIWSYGGVICVNGSSIRSIEIYDATGMKVCDQTVSAGINVINLPTDLYIVKAVTDNGIVSKKICNK